MNTSLRSEGKCYGWLNGMAGDFYDEGIVQLVQRLDKSLNRNGDYVEYEHMFYQTKANSMV
jgi:hypothetical protein